MAKVKYSWLNCNLVVALIQRRFEVQTYEGTRAMDRRDVENLFPLGLSDVSLLKKVLHLCICQFFAAELLHCLLTCNGCCSGCSFLVPVLPVQFSWKPYETLRRSYWSTFVLKMNCFKLENQQAQGGR